MNAVTTTTPADAFRVKASDLLVDAANMTLHQLVDEFMRLTDVMDKNCEPAKGASYPSLNDQGELAARERRVVTAAARARFGINFEPFDRVSPSESSW